MKIKLALLIFAALTVRAFAEDKPQPTLTVAVYDFNDGGKNGGGYGSKVTALVTADLTTETDIIMVERSDLKRALGEQAMGISGMVSSEQAAKIGQVTGAKVLVSGQVIKAPKNHLVIIANIVGTESGRLFAEKVEGPEENFTDLTSQLSRKIAQKIREQASNFFIKRDSHEEYLDHIVKSIAGTNRPSVSVNIHWPEGQNRPCIAANTEMGVILQRAGFTVVDSKAERKPDIEIDGQIETDSGPQRSHLHSSHAVLDIKVRERRTGKILAFEHEAADAVDIGQSSARKAAAAKATDALAERVLPLLAQ